MGALRKTLATIGAIAILATAGHALVTADVVTLVHLGVTLVGATMVGIGLDPG